MTGYSMSKVFNPKSGWYCGDFHVHTNASMDGDNPPAEVAEKARAEGLDFISITDHNTIEGISKLDENLGLPIIPGVEVTLNKGHFNIFGMRERLHWMDGIYWSKKSVPLPVRPQTVTELIRQTAQEGLLNSINHPLLEPWEWQYSDTDLQYIHCVELWNNLFWPDNVYANPKTVELWTTWLNAGYRVTAIGGSDYHYPPKPEQGLPGERLGQPTTYVYAEELSVPAILEGLRQQRAYVSRGPRVTFQVEIGGTTYDIGDDLGEQSGEMKVTVTISNKPDNILVQLVKNGEIIAKEMLKGREDRVQFRDRANPAHSVWYRLDVLDRQGQTLAITNPIFVGPRKHPQIQTYGELFNLTFTEHDPKG